ncbi:hypothetical protein [Tropicibacter naphthalenivorans]|uniref:Yip1 domain protein n=1 Tax=Tropicibacter naphthalenivorans TaxID=441103 RepID=A0A0P1G564_9RHOB|nr:hypothetical protein [Tropicibacter naphthalenivorans]CUH76802.1 hypothetical protein TRN7648_01133 [Tropicibacter naphthalenivorans]SMC62873.1 hypothetical protein SAMN04488093_102485 [Tropicibacter naphthalenivorans]
MPLTQDIVATYRRPREVVRRLLAFGPREDRALAFVMGGCAILFISEWPSLAREAHLSGLDLNMQMGGALLGTLMFLPLALYAVAFVVHLVLGTLTKRGTGYGSRLVLFWALLASGPLALLNGLTAGFVGPGIQLQITGVLWAVAFFVFWISGLRVVYGRES